jgi:hypothetical protein
MMTRFLMTISCVLSCAGAAVAFQPPAAPNGYVPIDQLPPAAQLPAAPLLIAAYAFVLVAVLIYVWTIWHRLNKVEHDLRVLSQRSQPR